MLFPRRFCAACSALPLSLFPSRVSSCFAHRRVCRRGISSRLTPQSPPNHHPITPTSGPAEDVLATPRAPGAYPSVERVRLGADYRTAVSARGRRARSTQVCFRPVSHLFSSFVSRRIPTVVFARLRCCPLPSAHRNRSRLFQPTVHSFVTQNNPPNIHSCASSHPDFLTLLSVPTLIREREMVQYYQYSADQGNTDAASAIGQLFSVGVRGINQAR